MGAFGAAGEHGERLFRELVEHGRALEGVGRHSVSETAETVEKRTQALGERARSFVTNSQGYVRGVGSGLKERLDLLTRSEFDDLSRRVDELTARVDSIGGPAASAAAGHHSTEESTRS
jgi:polyhydroxyalkanoate synthesis regulator phasin